MYVCMDEIERDRVGVWVCVCVTERERKYVRGRETV